MSVDGKRLYARQPLDDDPQSIALSQGGNIYGSIKNGNGLKSVTLGASSPA